MNRTLAGKSFGNCATQNRVWMQARRIILLVLITVMPGEVIPIWSQQSPQLGTLTADKLKEMGTTVQLDINLVRVHPDILQNRQFMRYFIALNNCSNPNIKKTLDNELEYPRVQAYYQSKASEIVGALPPSVTLAMFGGARSVHDTTITSDSLRLGDYDLNQHAFPLTFHAAWGSHAATPAAAANDGKDSKDSSQNITISLGSLFHKKSSNQPNANPPEDKTNHVAELEGAFDVHYNRENLYKTCPAASSETGHLYGVLPSEYTINAQRMGFDALPMAEADARQYIDKHAPTERQVMLGVYLRILDKDPTVDLVPGGSANIRQVTFAGTVARVSVFDNKTNANLGNLMDNHSLPVDDQGFADAVPPPPPPAHTASGIPPGTPPSGMNTSPTPRAAGAPYNSPTAGGYNMSLGINSAEAAVVESQACNWPIPDDQNANLQRYLTEASQNPAWAPSVVVAKQNAYGRLNAMGVRGFCSNSVQHYHFNSLLNTLWPKGPIAAPESGR